MDILPNWDCFITICFPSIITSSSNIYKNSFFLPNQISLAYSLLQWTREVKENVWTEIVAEKVKQQSEHLKKCELKVPADMLKQYNEEMELGDKTNREGHAAKVYFNALFGIDFSRSKDCAINAALNSDILFYLLK